MDWGYDEIDLGAGYSQRIYSGYKAWYLKWEKSPRRRTCG